MAPPANRGAPEGRAVPIDLALRPATRDALAAWEAYVGNHPEIAAAVAAWLGDGTTRVPDFDPDIRALAETVTLAPWQLSDASFATLRARGFDDAALFRICVAASTAGVGSRIRVALGSI